MDFSSYKGIELIEQYSCLLNEMRKQGLIRSKNVVGDLGEYIVVDYYCKTKGLPKLQFAPPSTKNIDAISIDGDRYSIKCITTNTTGAFYGIPKDARIEDIKQPFEYLVIVKLKEDFTPEIILELDWPTFFKFKHWHSRINAYNVIINKELISSSRIIYTSDK